MLLPQGYLAKKGGQWRSVKLIDLAVLLYNVAKGAEDSEVGFEDAQRTIEELFLRLNKKIMVAPDLLESALWSSNLLNEQGKWTHPAGMTFDEWVKGIVGPDTFNKTYSLIEKKD
jgi:hypothetical protein